VIGAGCVCDESLSRGADEGWSVGTEVVVLICSSWVVMLCLLWLFITGIDIGVEQLFKERAVVDERLALRLYADVALLLCEVKRVSGAVMLKDVWVVNRDIRDPLIKVVNWISTFAHHRGHETICLTNRRRRIVDECSLYLPPVFVVLCPRFGGQRDDVKLLSATFARDEFFFGRPLIADLAYGSLVLRSKLFLESL
jgi:hypothetical protein